MKKKVVISISIVLVLILVASLVTWTLLKGKVKVLSTDTLKYVAYVKINPSVKLDYSRVCTKYSDGKEVCDEPIVNNYELVNDDAKEIFNGVNLLAGEKDLNSVIKTICTKAKEKGIDTSTVSVESDWNDINNYLTEKQTNNENNVNNNTNMNNNNESVNEKINYSVKVENASTIENTVKTDEETEAKAKAEAAEKARIAAEEAARKAEEEKKKAEEAEKARLASTIKLSDNVTYCHSMQTFTCDNCFSNSLISTLKKAKGHNVVEADGSKITIKRINKLSGSYNKTSYYGTDYVNKITKAGGEEVGGAGGCEDLVTKAVCKEFNLICE